MIKIFDGSVLRKAVAVGSMALVCGLAAVPAAANAADSRCPTNRLCLFENSNYGGGRAVFATSDSNLNNNHYDNGHPVNDTSSSMINNTGQYVHMFSNSNSDPDSRKHNLPPNSKDASFVNNNFNDIASSFYFANS